MEETMIRIWDLPTRLFHWGLVASFALAYVTAVVPGFDPVHFWAGYTVAGLLVFRLIWGFVGPEHARFSDFAYPPREVIRHFGEIFRNRPRRYLGHSPAGSSYVFATLALVALIVVTGLIQQGYYEYEGPLFALGIEPAHGLAHFCHEVHEPLVNLMLILIVGHLAGVAAASIQHRESLVRAMITGFKPARNGGDDDTKTHAVAGRDAGRSDAGGSGAGRRLGISQP